MKLFKKHTMKNAQTAKDCLQAVARVNVAKYVIAQKMLNTMLASGGPKCTASNKSKKKCNGKCMPAKTNKILKKMATFQAIVEEANKTYGILFQEEINIKQLTLEAQARYYNMSDSNGEEVQQSILKDGKVILPENAPQDIQNVAYAIREALIKNGMSGDMEIVDMQAVNHGINPGDFEDFHEYIEAVKKARKLDKDIKAGKTSVKEALSDAVATKAEQHPEEIKGKA